MFVLSRRFLLLALAFALTLLIAPTFLAPQAIAQEATGFDLKTVLPVAANGGVGIIMLVVIVLITKKDKEQNDEKMKLFTGQLATQNETTKLAFEKYNESTQQLIALLKSSQDQTCLVQKDSQETTSLLTGTLSRLEVKLAQPIMCPFADRRQVPRGENNGQ